MGSWKDEVEEQLQQKDEQKILLQEKLQSKTATRTRKIKKWKRIKRSCREGVLLIARAEFKI